MPAGHLILWDWPRANVSKGHMSMPGPYVSWGCFRFLFQKPFAELRVSKRDPAVRVI